MSEINYSMNVIEVNFNQIIIRDGWNVRTQNLSELGAVNTLKTSIEEIGLLHPLQVNKNFELVSGFRRYRAIELLHWLTVPCNFVEYENEYHEKLANIDENLERKSLETKDLEKACSEKKKLYAILYPHTVQKGRKKEGEGSEKRFAEDTAKKTGLSPVTIDKLVKRVDNITPEVRQAYDDERINSSQVDEIAKLDKEVQNKVLKKVEGASVAETRLIVEDFKEAQKNKIDSKLMGKEDKLLAAIFDVEKVIKSLKQADILLEAFYHTGKHKHLDSDYKKRLHQNVNLLLHTIDRRMDITTFMDNEKEEVENEVL